jgi:phospholipid transport system substrate-binding protein
MINITKKALILFMLAPVCNAQAQAIGAPTQAVQGLAAAAREYADEKAPGLAPEEKLRRAAAARRLDTALDLHDMARRILAKQWDGLKSADREKYASLLAALVRKIGYPQIEKFFNGKIEISYEGEKQLDGGAAAVLTKIAYKEEDLTLATEFRLHPTEKGWRVYDVITDGESLLLIYRNQHSGIIKEKGFGHLLKLMEKKLNETK